MTILDAINTKIEIIYERNGYRRFSFTLKDYEYNLFEVHPDFITNHGKYASGIEHNGKIKLGWGRNFLETL